MKKYSICIVLFLFAAITLAGETKMNFSGEWNLNKDKSDLPSGRRRGRNAAIKMTVTQKKDTLTVERIYVGRNGEERTVRDNFTLDGKENVNERMNRKRTSTVEWAKDGKSLTINSSMTFERGGQSFEMKSSAKWSLDNEGKGLLIEYMSHTPRGERSGKSYYDKADAK